MNEWNYTSVRCEMQAAVGLMQEFLATDRDGKPCHSELLLDKAATRH